MQSDWPPDAPCICIGRRFVACVPDLFICVWIERLGAFFLGGKEGKFHPAKRSRAARTTVKRDAATAAARSSARIRGR